MENQWVGWPEKPVKRRRRRSLTPKALFIVVARRIYDWVGGLFLAAFAVAWNFAFFITLFNCAGKGDGWSILFCIVPAYIGRGLPMLLFLTMAWVLDRVIQDRRKRIRLMRKLGPSLYSYLSHF